MSFRKFDDVARLGKLEVEGILDGEVYIFEKIDGANVSLYWDEPKGLVVCSRNQEVFCDASTGNFRGLREYLHKYLQIAWLIRLNPYCIFYGEWLCQHKIQYPEDVRNNLYFFDIYNKNTGKYLHYLKVKEMMEEIKVNYSKALACLTNPKIEELQQYLNLNNFKGIPGQEGIVIKRYDYVNKFGRQQWAKIVNPEFIEVKNKPTVQVKGDIEEELVAKTVTLARVEKIINKIADDCSCFNPCKRTNTCASCEKYQYNQLGKYTISEKDIPQTLSTVFYDILKEELYDYLKKKHMPVIDFKKLQKMSNEKTKEIFFQILGRTKEECNICQFGDGGTCDNIAGAEGSISEISGTWKCGNYKRQT